MDKPSDASWLLSLRDSILPRIMEEIRPKVLPKLREENENAKKKSGKKKRGIKDTVTTEDFEVVIFLKELSTRHSLLSKQKHFADKPKLKGTGNKLTGWLNNSENPIDLDEDARAPPFLQEDDDVVDLSRIPEAPATATEDGALFVSSGEEDAFEPAPLASRKRKRLSGRGKAAEDEDSESRGDDKKKLALDTSYDGFSIYGRTLCLVVKRKGKKVALDHTNGAMGGSQMMEQWVSTQAARDAGLDEDNG